MAAAGDGVEERRTRLPSRRSAAIAIAAGVRFDPGVSLLSFLGLVWPQEVGRKERGGRVVGWEGSR